MSPLSADQFVGVLIERLHAASVHPAPGGFDGRRELPAWLVEAARDQASRVFNAIGPFLGEPNGRERFLAFARTSFDDLLKGWDAAVGAFLPAGEVWVIEGADAAAKAFEAALEDLIFGAVTSRGRA